MSWRLPQKDAGTVRRHRGVLVIRLFQLLCSNENSADTCTWHGHVLGLLAVLWTDTPGKGNDISSQHIGIQEGHEWK